MKAFPFYAGLFLVTNATMMLELIQTRILSVTAWYYLAFFVIGIGMFGLTAGAVWVYLKRGHYSCESLPFHLARHSILFSLSTAVSLLVELTLPLKDKFGYGGILAWALLSILLALPFFFSGIVVSLALTRSPFPIGRVYGMDLAGAAFGCLSVIFVLNHTDGPSAVLWTGASASLAGLLFSNAGINAKNSRGSPPALVRWRTAVLVLMAGGAALNEWSQNGLRPLFVKGKTEIGPSRPMFEEWNSFSRVAVFSEPDTRPHLWGPSPKFSPAIWKIEQRIVNIDGSAETRTYRISEGIQQAGFLKSDVTNLAYYLPNQERAAVIGMGGGRDVLSARVFGVPEITGVEINPILVRLLTDEPEHAQYANLQKLQGVRFVIDEARSWLARTDETFDVIQMSLVDTWASTGAGAFTLSENGLYTVEAWRIIIRRLTPRGVFTVSRWYALGNVNETGRLVSLGMATALDTGAANPRDHLFLAASGEIATLIYSRSPFSQAQLAYLEAAVTEQGFSVLIRPSKQPESSVLKGILASSDRHELERFTSGLSLDLTPPTDNRPFFFNQLPFGAPWKMIQAAYAPSMRGVASGNLRATGTLVLLFVLSAILVLYTIIIPLQPAVRDVGRKLALAGTAYFALLGAGFMLIEIGYLQAMSVFLGHPTYSLSIVLFSLILTAGIGSMMSDRLVISNRARFLGWACLVTGYLVTQPVWLPELFLAYDESTLFVRALVCVAVIAPAGALMGFGFPTGMRLISAVNSKPTPWFWGVNGGAGVLASSFAVACSIGFGIAATLLIGAVCYLLLLPFALIIGFEHPRQQHALKPEP